MVSKNLPLISIIITTKNEEANIFRCLESLKHQTYPQDKIEIIVVDNNSNDKTKEIAKKFTKRVYNLPGLEKMKKIKNPRAVQLNFGVKKSRGELIFFPDADMTFEERLVEEAANLIGKNNFDALFIPEEVTGKGLFGKIRNFERSFYNGTCIDALRIVKRGLFLKAGSFDEENIAFGFDDWDFNKKIKDIGAKIGMTANKIFHHEEELTLRKYLSKKGGYATTAEEYIQKWGKNDLDVKRQFGFWYRYFGVFTENRKWKRLIKYPILTGGMYFLRLGVGAVYLYQKFFKK
ncbi:MAG: glycosyltransferase [Patescibacteria group bacterium]